MDKRGQSFAVPAPEWERLAPTDMARLRQAARTQLVKLARHKDDDARD